MPIGAARRPPPRYEALQPKPRPRRRPGSRPEGRLAFGEGKRAIRFARNAYPGELVPSRAQNREKPIRGGYRGRTLGLSGATRSRQHRFPRIAVNATTCLAKDQACPIDRPAGHARLGAGHPRSKSPMHEGVGGRDNPAITSQQPSNWLTGYRAVSTVAMKSDFGSMCGVRCERAPASRPA